MVGVRQFMTYGDLANKHGPKFLVHNPRLTKWATQKALGVSFYTKNRYTNSYLFLAHGFDRDFVVGILTITLRWTDFPSLPRIRLLVPLPQSWRIGTYF